MHGCLPLSLQLGYSDVSSNREPGEHGVHAGGQAGAQADAHGASVQAGEDGFTPGYPPHLESTPVGEERVCDQKEGDQTAGELGVFVEMDIGTESRNTGKQTGKLTVRASLQEQTQTLWGSSVRGSVPCFSFLTQSLSVSTTLPLYSTSTHTLSQ